VVGEQDRKTRKKRVRKWMTKRKNQKLRDRKIYTVGGEIFSSITHGLTALVGLALLTLCIVTAAQNGWQWFVILSICVFGVAAIAGFVISTVYHALAVNSGKRVMRILDYCSIYWIIAATYTPFCIIVLNNWIGWTILAVNWTACIIGTTLTAIDRRRFKKFSLICYLVMGWAAVPAAWPLIQSIGLGAPFWLLLGGGVAYTLGAIVFKMKGKYTHGIWHLFTMAGLVCQFLSIYFLL